MFWHNGWGNDELLIDNGLLWDYSNPSVGHCYFTLLFFLKPDILYSST
jgi:hypothetical protein